MAIYRGIGGAGDSTTDATVTAVTEKAVEAAASAASASTSETNASNSASAASTSATNASNSASNASTSETNASNSASAASTSASNASTSETNAAASASAASTSETNAAASESAASTSETNAATSETNAATSETNASNSASAASTSASNAATSESNASTSETNAATSATNAATSETNAQTAADTALSALDNFDDRYLGQKASDPTLDNDGDALVAGALYFNTTDDVMKVYDGSVWVAAYASLSGTLVAVNNLSDVASVSSSRTNLGLGTAATTASTDYATAAQGALADSALQNLVEDTTPQLGGDLASNGNDINFGDGDKANFGADSDLQIYHTGGASVIRDSGTGSLYIDGSSEIFLRGQSGFSNMIKAIDGAAVELYHNNSPKLETTSTGIDVTGTVTADGLTVDTDTLHVDATNNRVGIATTSPSERLTVSGGKAVAGGFGAGYSISTRIGQSSDGADSAEVDMRRWTGGGTNHGTGRIATSSAGAVLFYTDAKSTDTFATTERMRIDSSGNVGIGRTSTGSRLEVAGRISASFSNSTTADAGIDLVDSSNTGGNTVRWLDSGGYVANLSQYSTAHATLAGVMTVNNGGGYRWSVNGSEGMRITSAGQVLVGKTSVYSSGGIGTAALQFGGVAGARAGAVSNQDTTAALTAIGFSNPNGDCGSIFTSGTSTTYTTSSDYRLKENNTPITNATERVKQLNPIRFNFIKDPDTTVDGFLAHEVAEVVPEAVSGEKDATAEVNIYDEDNNVIGTETQIVSQGIDQAKLVPLLVATIQELEARITALEVSNGS
jgi:hypothetical protein